MEFVEHLKLTKNRIIKQKYDLQEYLSLQLKNYKSLLIKENGFDLLARGDEKYPHGGANADSEDCFSLSAPSETFSGGDSQYISDWFFVGQDLIDSFAIVTLDDQWIHTDVYRARKESPFKGTIAHGFLILSLIPHLISKRDVAAVVGNPPKIIFNLGLKNVQFLHPLKSNLAIRARVRTVDIQPNKKGVQLTEEISIEGKTGKTICRVDSVCRVIFR